MVSRTNEWLYRHRVFSSPNPPPRSSRRDYIKAVLTYLLIAAIFACLGLDWLLFGPGFSDSPLQYIAAGLRPAIVVAILGLLVLGALNRAGVEQEDATR
jgi:hypothetical protein